MTVEPGETSTSYYLSESFIGGQQFEIAEDRYATLNDAITTVTSAGAIEDSFQVFAQSFVRFEKELLDVAHDFQYHEVPHDMYMIFSEKLEHNSM